MDRLRTRDLTKVYDRVAVVDRISLDFASGSVTALLGRNGAGKTTTFLMMAGIVRPDGGSVELNGESVDGIPSFARSQKGLIYLPQQHSVFLRASVFDNLNMVLQLYATEGDTEAAMASLQLEFSESIDMFGFSFRDPVFESLHGEPGWEELRERAGLTDADIAGTTLNLPDGI